jgi:putative transposase
MSNLVFDRNRLLDDVDDGTCSRVLWSEPPGSSSYRVSVIDVDDPRAFPRWISARELSAAIESGSIRVLPVHIAADALRLDSSLTTAERRVRDIRYSIIQNLVDDPEQGILYDDEQSYLIAQTARDHGVDRKFVRSYLRLYWQGGQVPGTLIPRYAKSGGKGKPRADTAANSGLKRGRPSTLGRAEPEKVGINVDAQTAELLKRGGRRFYELDTKPSLPRAYIFTLRTSFSVGEEISADGARIPILPPAHQLPTFGQFRYHYGLSRGITQMTEKREGARRYPLRNRPVLGTSTQLAPRPGALYQIDATVGDIYLLSSIRRQRVIGRPVIYIVVDVFSRMIVGFYVGLEGPSWMGMMMALENAFTDKVPFCQRAGRPIQPKEWPSAHLPEAIIGDRGELLSHHADFMLNAFNIRIDNTPPRRPDWKGVVERYFRILNDEAFHWAPGAVHGPRERGEKDVRLDARHTLKTLNRLLVEIVLHYNNEHRLVGYEPDRELLNSEVEPYPVDLWEWGVQNRSGALRAADREHVRLSLLPAAEASVTRQGLYFRGLRYTCSTAIEEGWFVRQPKRKGRTVPIGFDPRDVSTIYLRFGRGETVEECRLTPRFQYLNGTTWEEVDDHRAWNRVLDQQARSRTLQSEVEFQRRTETINQAAQAEYRETASRAGGALTTKGIRENRSEERRLVREAEAWTKGDSEGQEGPPTGDESCDDQYVPPTSELIILEELRDNL